MMRPEIINTLITALISATVSVTVAFLFALAKDGVNNNSKRERALEVGMRALLWRELCNIRERGSAAGGLTAEEKHHLEDVYAGYHNIGGNGTGTSIFEEAMDLPLINNQHFKDRSNHD